MPFRGAARPRDPKTGRFTKKEPNRTPAESTEHAASGSSEETSGTPETSCGPSLLPPSEPLTSPSNSTSNPLEPKPHKGKGGIWDLGDVQIATPRTRATRRATSIFDTVAAQVAPPAATPQERQKVISTYQSASPAFQQRQSTPQPPPSDTSEEPIQTSPQSPTVSPISPIPIRQSIESDTVSGTYMMSGARGPEQGAQENRASRANNGRDPSSNDTPPTGSAPPRLDIAQIAYSKNRYKLDAAMIIATKGEMDRGGFQHLNDIWDDGDVKAAKIILSIVDRRKRTELEARALSDLHSSHTAASSIPTFQRLLDRFREGPTELEEEEDEEQRGQLPLVHQAPGLQEARNHNDRSYNRIEWASYPIQDDHDGAGYPRREQGHEPHRQNRPYSADHPHYLDGYESYRERPHYASGYDPYRERPFYPDRHEPYRQRPHYTSGYEPYRPRPHYTDGYELTPERLRYQSGHPQDRRQQQNLDHTLDLSRVKRLRPEEVKYTGLTPVTSYINRIKYLTRTYGETVLLASLPMGMMEAAGDWFDSLSDATRDRMNTSLDEWIHQLLSRFKLNSARALATADRMRHTFADESQLDVRDYLTKKTQLYREAGEEQEDLIVKRLHEGLDPFLAAAAPLRPYDNTIADFTARIYLAEHIARAQFNAVTNISQPYARDNGYSSRHDAGYEQNGTHNRRMERRDEPGRRNDEQARRRESRPQSNDTPFHIPAEAARRIAGYQQAPVQEPITAAATTAAQAVARGPTSPIPVRSIAIPARREPYPCTHCGSKDHIDPHCPQRPLRPRTWDKKPAAPTPTVAPVHMVDYDDEDEEYLTPVDAETFYCYQALLSMHDDHDKKDMTIDRSYSDSVHAHTPLSTDQSVKEKSGH
jgi:hypothetical protein